MPTSPAMIPVSPCGVTGYAVTTPPPSHRRHHFIGKISVYFVHAGLSAILVVLPLLHLFEERNHLTFLGESFRVKRGFSNEFDDLLLSYDLLLFSNHFLPFLFFLFSVFFALFDYHFV